jgi:hypothetical protein
LDAHVALPFDGCTGLGKPLPFGGGLGFLRLSLKRECVYSMYQCGKINDPIEEVMKVFAKTPNL